MRFASDSRTAGWDRQIRRLTFVMELVHDPGRDDEADEDERGEHDLILVSNITDPHTHPGLSEEEADEQNEAGQGLEVGGVGETAFGRGASHHRGNRLNLTI